MNIIKPAVFIVIFSWFLMGMLLIHSQASTAKERGTSEQVKQDAEELIQSLKAYSYKQKEQALKKTEKVLSSLDHRIDKLEKRVDEQWKEMKVSSREQARASLQELHKKRVKVAEWYGAMKNSTDQAWNHMKEGVSEAFSVLQQAWEKAEHEYQ